LLAEEITQVVIQGKRGAETHITEDEHPRADTTLEQLQQLKPLFRTPGTVTAGNASGINDGAAALIVASEAVALQFGLTPRARILATAVCGVEPSLMGIGPVPAVRKVLAIAGLNLAQMDVIELNEAFAAQALAVLRQLELPDDAEHVNPQWRSYRVGTSFGDERGASGADRNVRTATQKGALCAVHHVYWRRAGHRDDP
jgi:3-oxo-5,6-didehydrosuberyl-CoA/3-oxoadipyl-CoA thiolase